MTVIHPHHPLQGQRVEVVRFRRGNDPDLIVVAPDGRHTAIALSSTDHGSPPETPRTAAAEHLLDLDGLRLVCRDEAVETAVASPDQPHTPGIWIKEMLL